ncbi:SDR family oxidoreductase [Candidatus Woesearchaeota archaeon]|nr:MAG: SDR family oxidoreductase [Candidatus Woesearchaeota archaeon]
MGNKKEEKVALVFGGAGELGKAVVRFLAREQHVVFFTSRKSRKRLREDIVRETGNRKVFFEKCSPVKELQVTNVVKKVLSRFGRIDWLLNFAGYDRDFNVLREAEPSASIIPQVRKVIEVDLLGSVIPVFVVEPIMRKQGQGTIITLGTTSVLDASDKNLVYQIARAGVKQMTASIRSRHRREGIRGINIVHLALGSVRNRTTFGVLNRNQRREIDRKGWLDANEDVAPFVYAILRNKVKPDEEGVIRFDAKTRWDYESN